MSRPMRAVLAGPIQQENLALQYLAASARQRGHEVEVVSYADRSELDVAVGRVLELEPDLLGLGIAFQNNVDDYVAFLRAVRRRGFSGHVTAGGHVPTFCYEELLRDVPELDSVVRHDGEETLLELLERLAANQPARDVPGLVWRQDGASVKGPPRRAEPDLDRIPWPERSAKPYVVGGLIVDFVITARGCVGECHYCSIAAYTSEQQKSFRLRNAEQVAREIAVLYHERHARVIFVQDDLFILPSEKRTVERVTRIRDELTRRGVGDLVFWIKGRPETITPEVCRASRAMGAIHMFLGVENASAERLEYLGRTHLPIHNHNAIANCEAAGITPSFTFMLFDPDSRLEDVAATLSMAERYPHLPWNVCRTEVYSGTRLRQTLEEQGRLTGNYRSYGYRMQDERAEMMFRIVRSSFHERALACESLLNRLISLSFARQLHEHFYPGAETQALSHQIVELGVAVRRDTLLELRRTLEFVAGPGARDAATARRFTLDQALAMNRRDMPWRHATEELWQHLNARGGLLSARNGLRQPAQVRMGYGVASGS